ncbi:MAG: hypothetical protein AB1722_00030 [Pseudomonadota bacterium]
MASNDLKPFEELHHTNKILRLEMFGGIKSNVHEHDNPLIECLFSPIEPPRNGYIQPFAKRNDQFLAGIAVGYLPTLFLGQFLQHGRQLPKARWPIETDVITFELDVSNPQSVVECLLPETGVDVSKFIHSSFFDVANKSCVKKLDGEITHSTNKKTLEAIKSRGGKLQQQVIIHEIELIRFYLTNSTHSAKNLFNGAFSDEQIGKEVINELHEKRSLDANTGMGRFVYRHGYRKQDVLTLGRILLDPTNLPLQAAQRVHKTIVKDRVNLGNAWTGYPRTHFPFSGRTTLKISGRTLRTPSGYYVFLANRIHSCSAPFPFKELSYCDDTQPGGLAAPADAPVAFSNAPPRGKNEVATTLLGTSKSDEPPGADIEALEIELGLREFVEGSKIKLRREKTKKNEYRSSGLQNASANSKPNASTGGPTSGNTSSAPQSIAEEIFMASEFTTDLMQFSEAIEKVGKKNLGWNTNLVVVGEDSEYFTGVTSFFPKVPCAIHKKTMRQFSFMDDEKTVRRRFICAQISVKGRYLYIFEAQLRPNGRIAKDGTPEFKERLPILLLHTPNYEEMQGKDFTEIIRKTVVDSTWPSGAELGVFIREVKKHGKGLQTVENLASRIKKLVEGNP